MKKILRAKCQKERDFPKVWDKMITPTIFPEGERNEIVPTSNFPYEEGIKFLHLKEKGIKLGQRATSFTGKNTKFP